MGRGGAGGDRIWSQNVARGGKETDLKKTGIRAWRGYIERFFSTAPTSEPQCSYTKVKPNEEKRNQSLSGGATVSDDLKNATRDILDKKARKRATTNVVPLIKVEKRKTARKRKAGRDP